MISWDRGTRDVDPHGFLITLRDAPVLLTEGSVYERLRRLDGVLFDPALAHAAALFDPFSRDILERIHRQYIEIGLNRGLAVVALADTWRANRERIAGSPLAAEDVNGECVRLMSGLREELSTPTTPVFVGGMLGPRRDAYSPQEAPDADEAESFHCYQVEKLAATDVDFLKAATIPAVGEAMGLARAMSEAGLPYFISFVIRADGTVLDGTPLLEAFDRIDQAVVNPPTGYYVNCVHPTVLLAALEARGFEESQAGTCRRLVGFHANTSARSPEELDGLAEIDTEDPHRYATLMRRAHERHGLKILGGCCGSGPEHMECLADELQDSLRAR